MKDKLEILLNNAYAPYSDFQVAAILVTKTEDEYLGVNVENASYGGSICAERNAINSAISSGEHPEDFTEIHIMAAKKDYCMPCLICRQTMVEFFNQDVKIVLYGKDGVRIYKMIDLVINPFSKEDLKWKVVLLD